MNYHKQYSNFSIRESGEPPTMLRKFRKAYGYSQGKFAEKCHIAQTYLCELETGRRRPSAGLARHIADIFGMKVGAVFPDGVADRDCRRKFEVRVCSPPPPARVVRYLDTCPKCGAQQIFERCYACGKGLEVEGAVV